MTPIKLNLSNWGNYPRTQTNVYSSPYYEDYCEVVAGLNNILPRGNGRCYGDAALADNILDVRALNSILAFDEKTGQIECQAGVLLSEIIEFIVPKGFFLTVTPGTKYITVGGAIASDVHGKNHHKKGCFSQYVSSLKLILPTGEIITCSSSENSDIFYRTIGGMGHTGIIVSARIELTRIQTSFFKTKILKAKNLEEMMALFEKHQNWTYSVAWMDILKGGSQMGRGLLTIGEHAELSDLPGQSSKGKALKIHSKPFLNIPFNFPSFVLNDLTVKAFNFLYYNKQLSKEKEIIMHYDQFFYPLDGILNWNRGYGRNGFTQYQFVLPKDQSYNGLKEILDTLRHTKNFSSFLVVLKLLGKSNPKVPWSFPMEGYTLALDIKIRPGIENLVRTLDDLVLKYGGRNYLTKDAFSASKVFELPELTNSKFISSQMKRLYKIK